MTITFRAATLGLAGLAALATSQAHAAPVIWADLTDQAPNSVLGTISTEDGDVGVSYSGSYSFAQTSGGTNYWTEGTPAPYTGGSVDNAPGTPDIIALNAGGTKTITFDQTVSDVYLALVSWNGNAGTFDQEFEVISQGCGYWGCGTFTNVTSTSFTGSGELHGIIRFTGTFDQITFTDVSENWHGIQIGIGGLAPVPEASTWAMMILGLGLTGAALRRGREQGAALTA
jgi:hypothetical protein